MILDDGLSENQDGLESQMLEELKETHEGSRISTKARVESEEFEES